MVFDRYEKKRRRNTGYYLAGLVCAVAVGLIVWTNLSSRDTAKKPTEVPTDSSENTQLDSMSHMFDGSEYDDEPQDISVQPEISFGDIEPEPIEEQTEEKPLPEPLTEAPKEEKEPVVEAAARPLVYMKPVSGSIQKTFSGDELVYSKTLDDWRTHNGVDIACKDGASVTAVAAGTVSGASKDDRYGNVVIVRHEDGSMAYYCGLENVTVHEGDEIKGGQKLGTAGEVPCECEEGAHLHLMFMSNGEFTDPLKALSLDY